MYHNPPPLWTSASLGLLGRMIVRATGWGLATGAKLGAIYGTLIWVFEGFPLVGTIAGAICGASLGFVLGIVNGLIIAIITKVFSSDRLTRHYREIIGLMAAMVNFAGFIIVGFINILTGIPGPFSFRDVIDIVHQSMDQAILFFILPAVIAALGAWSVSGKMAQWYQDQL